jgi:hypothetical protein
MNPLLSRLADAGLFALGFYWSIRLIAAAYGFIDLAHAFRTHWFQVAGSALVWTLGGLGLVWILGSHRAGFLWGLAVFAGLHVLSYIVNRHVLDRLKPVRDVPMEIKE